MRILFFILTLILATAFLWYGQPFSHKNIGDVSADLQIELEKVPLKIKGVIPSWLRGSLIRNGPINVRIEGKSNQHWFDGLAMLHAFSIQDGKVVYSNKFLRTGAHQKVFEERTLDYGGFAQDPCRTLFKRLITLFQSEEGKELHNANVNVAKLALSFVAMTETPLPVQFDPETLETLGVFHYEDSLPKERCWESAHPHSDPESLEIINYLTKFGRQSYYTLYRIKPKSAAREIIAEIPVDEPSYMHSFAITERYLILSEFPFVVNPMDLMIRSQAFIKNYAWKPERGSRFIVVDRKSGTVVRTFSTGPFFSFHHANAYEEGDQIHIDLVTYEDAGIITGSSLNVDSKREDHPTKLERFTLHLNKGTITRDAIFSHPHEFPRINDHYEGRSYRFVFATGSDEKGEVLYKIDTKSREAKIWQEQNTSPGEPVFVPRPEAKAEDDGILLAVVIDKLKRSSFLLVLDGQTFEEIGRAEAPHLIPEGLHGRYFPKS